MGRNTLSRRQFVGSLTAGSALALVGSSHASALARWRPPTPPITQPPKYLFEYRKLADDLYAIYNEGGNALILLDGTKEALLSDCKNPHVGFTLRREIEEHGYKLTQVINTHHHFDHSGGNYAFAGDFKLIGHANLVPRLKAQVQQLAGRCTSGANYALRRRERLNPDYVADLGRALEASTEFKAEDFVPTVNVKDEYQTKIGEKTVIARYLSPAHTDNDLFLHLPQHNVIHTGDLLFHELHPFIDGRAGATTVGWQKCLDAMIKLCDEKTVVVPGHGELTDVKGLRAQHEYFSRLRDIVFKARAEGRSRDEITALKPDEFADLGFQQVLPNALGVVYNELERGEG